MTKQWNNTIGILLFSAIFLVVVLIDVSIVFFYYRVAQDFIEDQDVPATADAGIVFFGDYTSDRSDIGPDSRMRADAAIQLFRSGKIRNIICVGGYDIRRWSGKPHHMVEYLVGQGIDRKHIVHDSLSFNTITNWIEACKIIDRNDLKEVVVVSAPLHVYRISRMIESKNVFYHTYHYELTGLKDYWVVFKAAHREWLSRFLSVALSDKLRNRSVHFYRTVRFEMKKVL